MLGEIMVKARDAGSMFWQALDDHERRYLILACCYVGLTLYSAVASSVRTRQREALIEEIEERLSARR